jgi:hypothetical protein
VENELYWWEMDSLGGKWILLPVNGFYWWEIDYIDGKWSVLV